MIRAKLIIRNVINKPLRSVIIILSLAAAAFAALFCIAGIYSAQNNIKDFFKSNYGDADMIMTSSKGPVSAKPEDLPAGSRFIGEAFGSIHVTVPNARFINYANSVDISVLGMDTKLGKEMKLLDSEYPTKDGLTMTKQLADMLNLKEGDIFEFEGSGQKRYSLKILAVIEPTRYMKNRPISIIVTPELSNEICGNKEGTFLIAYADIPDEMIAKTTEELYQKYPNDYFIGTAMADSEDTMGSMLNIYYLIFAVVFLMVCFIVVSMSRHIINERMSLIGMLRSIGGSIRSTGLILLAESAFYGLCGGVIGTLLYYLFRDNLDLGFFSVAGMDQSEISDGITPGIILLIILAVILLQCLFSLSAIIKAAKVPVRDIIFGTKETAYQPSKVLSVFGIILLALGVLSFFAFDDFLLTLVAAFCSTIGAVLVFPLFIVYISKALAALFGKLKMPVAKLAVKEMATTKSSISSAQLILSAMSLTLSVLIVAVSLIQFMVSSTYDADILLTDPQLSGEEYSNSLKNIDGVQDIENIYYTYLQYESRADLNGEPRDIVLVGYPENGFAHFTGIRDCPVSLRENEVAVDRILASKLSLKVGDEITLGMNQEKYIPTNLKLKITCLIDAGYFNSMGNTLMLDLDKYKSIFFDNPNTVIIKTEPGKAMTVHEILCSTLSDNPSNIKTIDDYMAEIAANSQSILSIIYAVIFLGLALSLLGSSSNMHMSFEQSRRKYAVYYSSTMSKSKLKSLILVQTIITSTLSVIVAGLFGLFFLQIISKALTMLDMSVPLVSPALYLITFSAVAVLLLTAVAIKPIRMLSKMKIAEEIKTSAD